VWRCSRLCLSWSSAYLASLHTFALLSLLLPSLPRENKNGMDVDLALRDYSFTAGPDGGRSFSSVRRADEQTTGRRDRLDPQVWLGLVSCCASELLSVVALFCPPTNRSTCRPPVSSLVCASHIMTHKQRRSPVVGGGGQWRDPAWHSSITIHCPASLNIGSS
jgi:hypothetical protein